MQLDVPRSDPPSWLDELQIALLWPERRWSQDGTLDLLSASSEFEGWLRDRRLYDKRHGHGWLSAITDFTQSARQIGPRLKTALKPELRRALDTADSLRAGIQSKGPAVLKTHLPSRLSADHAVYAAFKSRWTEPTVRGAAWQDFVEACRDETVSYDAIALRRDLFWHLMRAAGYDPQRLSQLLSGVLADIDWYVTDAQLWIGDIADEQFSAPRPMDQAAGLTETQRLALCQRMVTQQPKQAHRVIWLAFDRAGPGTGLHELGAVTFWHSELLQAILKDGVSPSWESRIPRELQSAQVAVVSPDLPTGPDITLARVDLGNGAFTDPVRIAAEQAESVVALAGFRADELRWRRIDGYLDFMDGRPHKIGSFGAPDRLDDMVPPMHTQFMAAELDRLSPRLTKHLPIADPDLTEVVQAVRWWQQARTQTPLAALLLDVRALEVIASRVGTTWEKYIGDYLRTTWVRLSIQGALTGTVHAAVHRAQSLSSEEHRRRVEAHRAAIMSFVEGGFTIDPGKCLDALPELAALFPVHTQLGRQLRTLDTHLISLTSLNAWCAELTDEWKRLDQRLQRLRNAISHGGPFQDEGVASTSRLGQRLAAWSLSLALEGILEGKTIATAHDEHVQREVAWWNDRRTASTMSKAIFGS